MAGGGSTAVVISSNLGAISAGTTIISSGTGVIADSNGISFGANGQTVTANYAAPRALAAGTQTATAGTVVMSNSNGLSFGFSGSTRITGDYSAPRAVAVGASTLTNGSLVLSNSNGVSFGFNGSTVTASASRPAASYWDNMEAAWSASTGAWANFDFTGSHRSLFVAPLHRHPGLFPHDMVAETMYLNLFLSGSAATGSVAHTSIFRFAVYTSTGATLSLLNSASVSFGSDANNANLSTLNHGPRFLTWGTAHWSSTPNFSSGSRYFFAWFWSSAGILNQTGAVVGNHDVVLGSRSGTIGVSQVNATHMGHRPFAGIYSATTGAFPASIANSELNKQVGGAALMIGLNMVADAAISTF